MPQKSFFNLFHKAFVFGKRICAGVFNERRRDLFDGDDAIFFQIDMHAKTLVPNGFNHDGLAARRKKLHLESLEIELILLRDGRNIGCKTAERIIGIIHFLRAVEPSGWTFVERRNKFYNFNRR